MITGDHPLTAKAVARELGMLKTGRVVTGAELDEIDDESEFERTWSTSRSTPASRPRTSCGWSRRCRTAATSWR